MTQEVLVQVIFMLCNGYVTDIENSNTSSRAGIVKEIRINCFEEYTNCAIGPNGKILVIKEFQRKCVHK